MHLLNRLISADATASSKSRHHTTSNYAPSITTTTTKTATNTTTGKRPKLRMNSHGSASSTGHGCYSDTRTLRNCLSAVYTAPCVLAVLCYLNSLPGDFLHDDVYAIQKNPDVTGSTSAAELFLHDFWGKPMDDPRSHKSYRPLTVLSFRLDYRLSGGDPRWFHAVNIVLHACVTAMVALVSMRVLKTAPTVAMMAAAHFAVHPIHTEAVTGIVGRADLLAALFFLTSFYFYSKCIPEDSAAPSSPPSPSTPPSTATTKSTSATPDRDVNFNHLQSVPSLPHTTATSPVPSKPTTPSTSAATEPAAANSHTHQSVKQEPWSTSLQPPCLMTSHAHFLTLLTSLLLAGMAVLCKETGVTVLGVALVYDVIVCRDAFLGCLRTRHISQKLFGCAFRCCCLCVWGAAKLLLRMWVMDFRQPHFQVEDNPAAVVTSLLTRTLTFAYLPTFNFWLLLYPATLSYDWAVGSIPLVTSFGDTRIIWTCLVYAGILGLMWYSLRRLITQRSEVDSSNTDVDKTERGGSEPGLVRLMALVLLCVPFIPASNLFFYVGFVVAERVLYIPSIGLSLLLSQSLSCLCRRLPGLRTPLTLTFITLLLVLGLRTTRRNTDWYSRRSLFLSGVRSLPGNAKMHYNMANLLRDEGDLETAELHYREAISLFPQHPSYHLNLGAILTNQSEAELCYQETLRLHPGHTGALVNLASLWIDEGHPSQGLPLLQDALDLDPDHAEAQLAMGKALMDQGETSRAGRFIQGALEARPDWASARLYHAAFLQLSDNLDAALKEYLHVLDLAPSETPAMMNAARILVSQGRYTEAEQLLNRSLQLTPTCSECLSVLASCYSRRGQLGQAVVTLGQACSLAPNDTHIGLKYVQALKRVGQGDRARDALQRLMVRVPDDLSTLTFAYNYAMEEKRLADASAHIRAAVGVAERTSHASLHQLYYEQGEIYRLEQNYQEALQFYERSIALNQQSTEAIVSAGSVLYLMRRYTEAEVFYQRALKQQPQHELARQNLDRLRKILESSRSRG